MSTARVNGYEMVFVEQGSGVPLVLVHGTCCDYRYWSPNMASLAEHYRTIAVSLRHCWPEHWDGDGDDFTTQQHTEDIADFIAELRVGPAHLLGSSRGAYVAFRVAQHFPHLVRALVLMEPGGVLDPELETAQRRSEPPMALGPLYSEAADRIRPGKLDEGLEPFVDVILGPGGWRRLPEWVRQMLRDNALTLLGQIREARPPLSRADVEAVRAPTLLIAGERSPAAFHRVLDGLESALGDVRRAAIPNASHASNIDNPHSFECEVLKLLREQ